MLAVSWCGHQHGRRGGERERRGGKRVSEKRRSVQTVFTIFVCAYIRTGVGGCRLGVCENSAGAEVVGKEVLDSKLEEARVILQWHEESFQRSTFLQRPRTWVRLYESATVTDLWGLYIYFLRQSLAWHALGQLVGGMCLILLLNWKIFNPEAMLFLLGCTALSTLGAYWFVHSNKPNLIICRCHTSNVISFFSWMHILKKANVMCKTSQYGIESSSLLWDVLLFKLSCHFLSQLLVAIL